MRPGNRDFRPFNVVLRTNSLIFELGSEVSFEYLTLSLNRQSPKCLSVGLRFLCVEKILLIR
jgi:hypothetical protein